MYSVYRGSTAPQIRGVLLYKTKERRSEMEKEFKKVIGNIRLYGKLQSSDESVGLVLQWGIRMKFLKMTMRRK